MIIYVCKTYKILFWVAVIIWMVVIFNLSSHEVEQSNQLSSEVTEIIVKTIKKVTPKANFNIKTINNMVRKNAHFFSYLILGVLVMLAIRQSSFRGYMSIILAVLVCVIYAASDEIHQLFVPGRGGQFKDVVIDSAGAITGIGIYLIVSKIAKKRSIRG